MPSGTQSRPMPAKQLDITGRFDKQTLSKRKKRIRDLQTRAKRIYEDWVAVFGAADTPVPVDRAWHNLSVALDSIQREMQYKSRVAMAEEQLDQAEWIIDEERQ
jgi:hypothetical protein